MPSRDELETLLFLDMPQIQTDIALVFGTGNLNELAGQHAAKLYHEGAFPTVIVSGGNLARNKPQREFAIASDALRHAKVPREAIRHEEEATNTGENVAFSLPLGLEDATSIALICCLPHQLRVLKTARRILGDASILTVIPYLPNGVTQENWYGHAEMRHLALSEYQKIGPQSSGRSFYEELGFCAPVDLDEEYRRAARLPRVGAPQAVYA